MTKKTAIFITALILGLGWAIRGHFGHEWGASWAGAMGALAILTVFNRKDWMRNAPILTMLGAVGWAVGGMMSYGIVVGYCRGTDFINVAYGYAMLAVIGGLYGFIGGGLLGLGLESSDEKKTDWPKLITEMFVGGFLVWGFFIYQLEWFMTPPRSELWAGCLGAAFGMTWYMYRNGYKNALRVAGYSSLGAGFGFSFGNFLQVVGSTTGIAYNWWNVMEFTLGFCGGLGMAYGISKSKWPEQMKSLNKANWVALIFVFFLIPYINFIDAFDVKGISELAKSLNITDIAQFIFIHDLFGWMIIVLFTLIAVFIWKRFEAQDPSKYNLLIPLLLFSNTLYYTIFSYLRKGIFYKSISLKYSDTLYVPILIAVFILWFVNRKKETNLTESIYVPESSKRWIIIFAGFLMVILIIALISINFHEGLSGAHDRF